MRNEMEGLNYFDMQREAFADNGTVVLFEESEQIEVRTEKQTVRFLLVSGKPLREPVAWSDPIGMNTQEELRLAFEEYENGTFLK